MMLNGLPLPVWLGPRIMKVSNQNIENRQAVLNIEVEPQEMEESLDKVYHDLVKQINIPGFRRGKAPRLMLERYIGKEGLQKEALDYLIPRLCNQAIEEQQMEVIAQPEVEILQNDDFARDLLNLLLHRFLRRFLGRVSHSIIHWVCWRPAPSINLS
jgi:hypothetical protein